MRTVIALLSLVLVMSTGCASDTPQHAGAPPALEAWNDGAAKANIIEFVRRVSTPGTPDFVSESDRVAVFDNDGTLWSEAPVPIQFAYVLDELKRRASTESALAADPMVQAALRGDTAALLAGDRHDGLLHVMALTHLDMTTEEFSDRVSRWLATAHDPRFGRRYDQLTYEPQQQLLNYLRTNGFRTYIVSGGGADFMRVFSERVYGIAPEQVVGSTATVKFEMRDGKPVLVKTAN
jgi:phosphoglycolate phosphatase-like HAD superfamily hydrolase